MIISTTFPSIMTTTISYKTSHVKVATNSHVKVQTMNSLETQQPMFSVNKKLQYIVTSERVNNRDFQQPHILNHLIVFYDC